MNKIFFLAVCLLFATADKVNAQKRQKKQKTQEPLFAEKYYDAMQWRNIGPFRGGRSAAVTGVPGKANLYYFGATGGGVWRTTDAGNTWDNISDGFF